MQVREIAVTDTHAGGDSRSQRHIASKSYPFITTQHPALIRRGVLFMAIYLIPNAKSRCAGIGSIQLYLHRCPTHSKLTFDRTKLVNPMHVVLLYLMWQKTNFIHCRDFWLPKVGRGRSLVLSGWSDAPCSLLRFTPRTGSEILTRRSIATQQLRSYAATSTSVAYSWGTHTYFKTR